LGWLNHCIGSLYWGGAIVNKFKFPSIEIKFGNCSQTNEQIMSVYIKTIKDALAAARNDKKALSEWNKLFKEGVWMTDDLLNRLWQEENP